MLRRINSSTINWRATYNINFNYSIAGGGSANAIWEEMVNKAEKDAAAAQQQEASDLLLALQIDDIY